MRLRALVFGALACVVAVAASSESASAARPVPAGVSTLSRVPSDVRPMLLFAAGDRVVVFGIDGRDRRRPNGNVGVVYDVKKARWTRTAAPPFHPPILWPSGVWIGGQLVVVGVSCENRATVNDEEPRCYPGSLVAGVYDLPRNRWRRVEVPASLVARFPPGNAGFSGHALGTFDGDAIFSVTDQMWAFDAQNKNWMQLPLGPIESCVAGRFLVGRSASALAVISAAHATPVEVPPVPQPDAPGPQLFVCGDDSLYAYTSVLSTVWRYDLGRREWELLPAPPSPTAFVDGAIWTGRGLLFSILIRSRDPVTTTNDGFLFEPASGTWRMTPSVRVSAGDDQVWSDGFAYQLGYEPPSRAISLQTYRPT